MHDTIKKPQLVGGKPVGYLQSVLGLTEGSPKTNPDSGQDEIWTRNFRRQIPHADHWPLNHPASKWFIF